MVTASSGALPSTGFWPTARRTFIAWELLRLVYNAVLVGFTLYWLGENWPHWNRESALMILLIEGGLLANIAYLAGAPAELYLAWLGIPRLLARMFLFVGGLGIALVLAALTLWTALEHWETIVPKL